MALKNLFDMVKADRYTQDGREAIIKAQEEETEDKVYQIGEISQKTGLQKTANGWVKPKKGAAPAKKENPTRTFEFKAGPDGNPVAGSGKEVKTYKTKKEAQEALKKQASMMEPEPFSSTESKPAENKSNAMPKVNGPDMAVRNFESKGEKVTNWNGTKNGFLISTTKGDYQYVEKADGSFELMDRPNVTQGEALQQSIKSHGEKTGSKPVLSQTDGKGNEVEIKITESKGGGFYVDKYVNGKKVGINNANTRESAEAKAKSMMEQHMADPDYKAESKPAAAPKLNQVEKVDGANRPYRIKGTQFYFNTPEEAENAILAKNRGGTTYARPSQDPTVNNIQESLGFSLDTPYGGKHSMDDFMKKTGDNEYAANVWSFGTDSKGTLINPLSETDKPNATIKKENGEWKLHYKDRDGKETVVTANGRQDPTRDSAPRVLTGDCRIRIRKEKPALTGDTKIRVRK